MKNTRHADTLTTEERKGLKDSDFGIPETREFPLIDAAHVRSAEAYFRYAPENKKAMLARKILDKAKEFGVHISSPTILEWAEK